MRSSAAEACPDRSSSGLWMAADTAYSLAPRAVNGFLQTGCRVAALSFSPWGSYGLFFRCVAAASARPLVCEYLTKHLKPRYR